MMGRLENSAKASDLDMIEARTIRETGTPEIYGKGAL
jgi:hypothetical protein